MNLEQILILCVVVVLGTSLIGSYVPIIKDYTNHDYWVGTSTSSRKLFYVCWVLAAFGFVSYIIPQLVRPLQHRQGVLSYRPWIKPLLLCIILISSMFWSLGIYMYFNANWSKVWSVIPLILVAGTTLVLLAGEAQTNAPWYRLLSLMCFAVTVVLIDPTMWTGSFILFEKE